MATIKIRRTNDYINALRVYRLIIDGQTIGTIGNGQTKDFDIPAGNHTIVASIDWCRSPELYFETNDKNSNIILVGGLKSWRWLMPLGSIFIILALLLNDISHYITTSLVIIPVFYLLYYLTIGRKKYLTIKEIKKAYSSTTH